jgi:hypothetical protein
VNYADRFDRRNTGGGSLQVSTESGNIVTVGADVYTGDKLPGQSSELGTPPDPNFFAQSPDQQALNNGQMYINITGNDGFNATLGGKQFMFPQNAIHALRGEKKFVSTATGL